MAPPSRFARGSLSIPLVQPWTVLLAGVAACRGPEFTTGGGAPGGGGGGTGGGTGGAPTEAVVSVTFKDNLGPLSGRVVVVGDPTGAPLTDGVTESNGKVFVNVPLGGWVVALDDRGANPRVYAARIDAGVNEVVFFGADETSTSSSSVTLSASATGLSTGDLAEFHLPCAAPFAQPAALGNPQQTHTFSNFNACPNTGSTLEGSVLITDASNTPKRWLTVSGAFGPNLSGGVMNTVSPADLQTVSVPIANAGSLSLSRRIDVLDADGFALRSHRAEGNDPIFSFKLVKAISTNLRVVRSAHLTQKSTIVFIQHLADAQTAPGTFDATSLAVPDALPTPSFTTIGQPEVAPSLGGGPVGDAVTIDLVDSVLHEWVVTVPVAEVGAPVRFPKLPSEFDSFNLSDANSAVVIHADVPGDYASYLAGGLFATSSGPNLIEQATMGTTITQY